MFLQIVGTEEVFDDPENPKKGKHTRYIVHVNGCFHCTLRYSQIHAFHKSIQEAYGDIIDARMPGKKPLGLSTSGLRTRMKGLEAYLQAVAQHPTTSRSHLFEDFLSNAQEEVHVYTEEAEVPIALANGKSLSIACFSSDSTYDVLESFCRTVDLPAEFTPYFGLFLTWDNGLRVARILQPFECPVLVLERANVLEPDRHYQIQARKVYFYSKIEVPLLENKIATNMAYTQAVQEMKTSHLKAPEELKRELLAAKSAKDKPTVLRCLHRLRSYNNAVFTDARSSYPEANTACSVVLDFLALRIRVFEPEERDFVFKITQFKGWKVVAEADGELSLFLTYVKQDGDALNFVIQCSEVIHLHMSLHRLVAEIIRTRTKKQLQPPEQSVSKESLRKTLRERPAGFVPHYARPTATATATATAIATAADADEEEQKSLPPEQPIPTVNQRDAGHSAPLFSPKRTAVGKPSTTTPTSSSSSVVGGLLDSGAPPRRSSTSSVGSTSSASSLATKHAKKKASTPRRRKSSQSLKDRLKWASSSLASNDNLETNVLFGCERVNIGDNDL